MDNRMNKSDKEAMEKEEKATVATDDEPEINYRGWKAMPFIIGNFGTKACLVLIFCLGFLRCMIHGRE